MVNLLLRWVLSSVALIAVAYVYSGVTVASFSAALLAAAVIGLLNTLVKPVLFVLTLPITVLTLGVFYFVLNALLFWASASLLEGFQVQGFTAALLGSLIFSIIQMALHALLRKALGR